jgi:hypothetical protein
MTSAALGLNRSKRLRLDGASPWPEAGFDRSINGNALDPSNPNAVIGSNALPKSSGVNDNIEAKYIVVPTKYPLGNKWADNIPLGALCLTRNLQARKKRNIEFISDEGGIRGIFKEADRVQILTPERVNYTLHDEALRNKKGAEGGRRSLYQVADEWKVAGIMASPPEPNYAPSSYVNRLSEERYVNLRPLTDGLMTNYFGEIPAGDVNSVLFGLWVETNVGPQTTYVTETDGEGVYNLNNKFTVSKKGEVSMDLQTVPAFTVRCSDTNYLSLKNRSYTIEVYNESDPTKPKKVKKYGIPIRLGRCKVNPVYNEKVAAKLKQPPGVLRDMRLSNSLPQLNVQVDIQEKFVS